MRVFIYGSCVTRDTVPFWDAYGFELVGYVARQCLTSAYSPAKAELFVTERISSAFQKRMVEGDIVGNLPAMLKNQAGSYDLILWDLTDERGGLYQVPKDGHLTRLAQYKQGTYIGTEPLVAGSRFGEDSHFADWCDGVGRLLSDLDSVGKRDALVANAIPWADRIETGEPLDMGGRPDAAWFNPRAERYFDHLDSVGVHVARTDPSHISAKVGHQWGLEPYHFSDNSYIASLDAIAKTLK